MIRRLKRLIHARNPLRLLWHRGKALAAAALYGFPARRLTVIGITGTDGKTTTVGMTAHILQASGFSTGALSTAFFRVKDDVTWNATQKTSPSPFVIQRFLRTLVRAGCTHAVLEYSSHGLVQGRSGWTWPSVAAITNTSFEHLDYHGSMEQYRRDKGLLFAMLRGRGTKVLHREDPTFAPYCSYPSERTIGYATAAPSTESVREDTILWADALRSGPPGVTASLHRTARNGNTEDAGLLRLSVPGLFNVENALCALACAEAAGISPAQSVRSLETFTGIPGRLESIEGPQSFTVYVDFTVTPVAYEKTLSSIRSSLTEGKRLLVLTGSCGDRMREKRPEVGRICSSYADVVVVSNEDPYTEDPGRIIEEVWSGIDQSRAIARKIPDRLEAIRYLFSQAKEGDVVLLCGKGSDTTMMTNVGQIPWNEREIARMLLNAVRQ
ncbi:MAG: UDP-N-acetylmuramyl-tripeptide synthetase [Candidatus Peribacteraceae bacterium]|nr:UDP-N-acetylmuramyl-tripeptide synthetase [Candidatus Peribacteraceae bacterium]